MTDDCYMRPTLQMTDWIKIGYLSVLFLLGAFVNVVAFAHLKSIKPPSSLRNSIATRWHVLKVHLNITNLLAVFVYALSDLIWSLTYEWMGGDLLCKVVAFGRTFAFYSSSNIIVCFALNRYFTVAEPTGTKLLDRTRWSLYTAWTLAFICSIPQLNTWQTAELPLCDRQRPWSQCADIWDVLANRADPNDTTMRENINAQKRTYQIVNLAIMFYIPTVLIALCYAALVCRLSFTRVQAVRDCLLQSICYCFKQRYTTPSVLSPPSTENMQHLTLQLAHHNGNANETESVLVKEPTVQLTPAVHTVEEGNSVLATSRTSPKTVVTCLSTSHNPNDEERQQVLERERGLRHARRVAIRTSFVLIIAYIICWTPHCVLQMVKAIAGTEFYNSESAQMWDHLNAIIVVNALINPFLYDVYYCSFVWQECCREIDD